MEHIKIFIKGALSSALNGLLVSILNDPSEIKGVSEFAIILVATTQKPLLIIVLAIAKDAAAMALISHYAAKLAESGTVSEGPSLYSILHSTVWFRFVFHRIGKSRQDRSSKGRSTQRKSSILPSDKDTWSLRGSMNKVTKLSESSMMRSDVKDMALELKVLHTTYSHFRNATSHKSYCSLEK